MVWWPFSLFTRQTQNANAIALNGKLRTFVNAYVQARNSGGNSTSGNAAIAAALKAYINVKRPAAGGAAAGSVAAAGAPLPVQQAAAAAVGGAPVGNRYSGMNSSQLANEANKPNLTPGNKINLIRAINAKVRTMSNNNKKGPQFNRLENAKGRLMGASNSPNRVINAAISQENFGALNSVNLITGAANKLASSNNKALRNKFVNFVNRQLKTYAQANRNKLKTAANKVRTTANAGTMTQAQSAQAQAPPNNRFKNMNINALVNSAAQSLSMSNENKAKLKAAMNAKIKTPNENSMNRVRLVNALGNLN